MLVFALVFVWYGIKFVQFGWNQTSELAELPMACIFVAWPLTGFTWLLFGCERLRATCVCSADGPLPATHDVDRERIGTGSVDDRRRADARASPRCVLFGAFFALMVAARAGRVRARARLPAGAVHRAAPVADGRVQHDVQGLQLVHPAGGAVLPADREPDERRRHHRPAGARCRATMVGNFPGALAQINVLLSVFFAGISGSSTADAASQGKIFIEAQVKEGYDLSLLDRDHRGVGGAGGDHPAVDPDDRLGRRAAVSIGALYLAGVIPGLLLGLAQMATVHVYAKVRHYPTYPRATFKRVRHGRRACRIPALMTPFIIVGGILLGWFTATESAAARGDLRGGAVDLRLPRDGPARSCGTRCSTPASSSAIALFCVGTASVFGWLLAYLPDPEGAARERHARGGSGLIGVGFFIAFVFLVVGCFLDAIPAIIIVGTMLQPLAASVQHAPGVVRDHRHRLAGLRAGHAAVRAVPDDLLRDRQGAACATRSRTR